MTSQQKRENDDKKAENREKHDITWEINKTMTSREKSVVEVRPINPKPKNVFYPPWKMDLSADMMPAATNMTIRKECVADQWFVKHLPIFSINCHEEYKFEQVYPVHDNVQHIPGRRSIKGFYPDFVSWVNTAPECKLTYCGHTHSMISFPRSISCTSSWPSKTDIVNIRTQCRSQVGLQFLCSQHPAIFGWPGWELFVIFVKSNFSNWLISHVFMVYGLVGAVSIHLSDRKSTRLNSSH